MYFLPQYARHMANTDKKVKGQIEFQAASKCIKPDAIGAAIIDSFIRCEKDNPNIATSPGVDVWTPICLKHHAKMVELVKSNNKNAVIGYLENIHKTSFATGILDTGYSANEEERESWALTICSHLTAVAEAVGAIPLPSPFIIPDENMYRYDLGQLLCLVEKKVGQAIQLPNVFNGFGIKTDRGIITDRIARALLTAIQLRSYCNLLSIDFRTAKLCEIGGGAGLLAYFCWQFGARNYTIFDLPTTNILQTYLLLNALPDANIVTYHRYVGIEPGCINILPFWRIVDCTSGRTDIFINEDSLPEIETKIALAYLQYIKRSSRYFLSLNQESYFVGENGHVQRPVYQLIEESGGFERLLRLLHWGLAGYSMELYRVIEPASRTA